MGLRGRWLEVGLKSCWLEVRLRIDRNLNNKCERCGAKSGWIKIGKIVNCFKQQQKEHLSYLSLYWFTGKPHSFCVVRLLIIVNVSEISSLSKYFNSRYTVKRNVQLSYVKNLLNSIFWAAIIKYPTAKSVKFIAYGKLLAVLHSEVITGDGLISY